MSEDTYSDLYKIASDLCSDGWFPESDLEDFLDLIQGSDIGTLLDCLDDYNHSSVPRWIELWVLN